MENPPQFDHDLPPMFFVQRPAVLTVGILFPILGTIVVGLRLWSSSHRKAGLGIDDWLILPALVSGTYLPRPS